MLSIVDMDTNLGEVQEALIRMSSTELARAVDDMTVRQARGAMEIFDKEIARLERVKLSIVNVKQTISRAVR